MDIKQIFIDQITIVQTLLLKNIANIQGRSLYTQSGKLITESLISIDKVLENPQIQIHDRILLEKSYCRGHDTIHMKLEYFNAYYYAYQNIKREGFQQQLALSRLNDETAAMLTTILGFNRKLCAIGSSTDDYFVTRMENALWAVNLIIKKKITGLYLPTLYALVNFQQSLSEYLFSEDQQYRTGAKNRLKEINIWLKHLTKEQEAADIMEQNLQLRLFYITQHFRASKALGINPSIDTINIESLPNSKIENKLRILTSVYLLDPVRFKELFEPEITRLAFDISRSAPGLDNILFLRCLAFYSIVNPFFDNIDLVLDPIEITHLNLTSQLKNVFNQYDNAHGVDISEEEMQLLLKYDDNALRLRVANIILGADKFQLDREKIKPHGVFEISDMELRIKLGQQFYFLCMPFKSGIEIKTPSVPESIAYQILKPFTHLNQAVVVFITAKRCSQSLISYIKRVVDKFGFPIEVIENEELAKLLKINDQLN